MPAPKPARVGRPRKSETPLAAWLDREGMTRDHLADKLEVTRQYVDKLCRGASKPSLQVALAIEKLSGGTIKPSDWG